MTKINFTCTKLDEEHFKTRLKQSFAQILECKLYYLLVVVVVSDVKVIASTVAVFLFAVN